MKLGLKGTESFDVFGISDLKPKGELVIVAKNNQGSEKEFKVLVRLDSAVEISYYHNGGILHTVLRNMATKK